MNPEQRKQFTDDHLNHLCDLLSCKVLKQFSSFSNIVYHVIKKDESLELVLRISHSENRSIEWVEEEISWLLHLHNTIPDFTANKPLKNNDKYIQVVKADKVEFYAVAFSLVKGLNFLDIDPSNRSQVYENIGRLNGKMHKATKTFTPGKVKRFTYIDEYCIKPYTTYKTELQQKYPFIDEKYHLLMNQITKFHEENPEDFGLIHGDIQPSNYLIDRNTLQPYLFDFDASCYCHYVMDVSNIVFYGIVRHENHTKEEVDFILKSFLKGYKEEYQLVNEDKVMSMIDAYLWLRLTITFIYFLPHNTEPFTSLKTALLHDLENSKNFIDCTYLHQVRDLIVQMNKSN